MKPVVLALGVLFVTLSSLNASAADCRTIVANTLAELKAGYPEWDESMETLVRTAAGSACVKASAAAQHAVAPSAPQMQERAVRADGEVVPMTPAPSASAVSSTSTTVAASDGSADSSSDSSEAQAENGDSGWNPFKEIKFNKVSASPSKKPYERRRDVNKAAPADEEDE